MVHGSNTACTDLTNGVKFDILGTNTLKYNSVCIKLNRLAAHACIVDDTCEVVSYMVTEAKKVVAAMHKV
jgi:aspartate 1-decarboxylase